MKFLGYFSTDYADAKGREYYFDNAKFILIFMVVWAHALSAFRSSVHEADMLWTVIYTMHMPCLIMISGYFAKSYVVADGRIRTQRVFTYIIYYLAAQLSVSLFEYFVLGTTDMPKSILHPRSSLWYLLCLVMWFIILPYIARLKPVVAMLLAVLCALAIGYDTAVGNFLSMSRAISHFPFFLVGYYFKKEWLFKYRNIYSQIAAVLVVIMFLILGYFYPDMIPERIMMGNYNYYSAELINFTELPLMFINRVIFFVAALMLCFSFMLLVPRGKAFFSKLGSRTLAVYILHKFIYLSYMHYKWYQPFLSRKGMLLVTVIVAAITVVLSLKPFSIPFELLAKIKISRWEKPELNAKK